jgi:hypothetical protein
LEQKEREGVNLDKCDRKKMRMEINKDKALELGEKEWLGLKDTCTCSIEL